METRTRDVYRRGLQLRTRLLCMLCRGRSDPDGKQSVQLHIQSDPSDRHDPARTRDHAGRTFPEVPRSVATRKRVSDPRRRDHNHFYKGNIEHDSRLVLQAYHSLVGYRKGKNNINAIEGQNINGPFQDQQGSEMLPDT